MSFIIFLFRKRSIFAIKDRTFDSRTCIYRTFNLSNRKLAIFKQMINQMSVPSLYPYRYISSGAGILYFHLSVLLVPLLGNICIVRTFLYPVATYTSKNKRVMATKQWIGIEEAATKYQVSTRRIITWCERQRLFIQKSAII